MLGQVDQPTGVIGLFVVPVVDVWSARSNDAHPQVVHGPVEVDVRVRLIRDETSRLGEPFPRVARPGRADGSPPRDWRLGRIAGDTLEVENDPAEQRCGGCGWWGRRAGRWDEGVAASATPAPAVEAPSQREHRPWWPVKAQRVGLRRRAPSTRCAAPNGLASPT